MKRSFWNPAVAAVAAILIAPGVASAHFLWITVELPAQPQGGATIHTFLNETPEPGGPEFLKFVKDVRPSVVGQALPVAAAQETVDASWAGKLPVAIDAERDLGVKAKNGESYRLFYTARAQTEAFASDAKETVDKLRVRLVAGESKHMVQVLFDGKPAARARLKIYPSGGDAKETAADDQGTAVIEGLAEGKTALWANWSDRKPGEVGGKKYSETRFYATLTFQPRGDSSAKPSTTFATMPSPAVNSFGGAVLGDWLYVYSGHVGKTHEYNTQTTSRKFRRLSLKDPGKWEELPMSKDLQGVSLVSDGERIFRIGGMMAKNQPDKDHDLYSVADFASFDPVTKTWADLTPMPVPRSTHDAVVVGRKVYAIGGWRMQGETEKAVYLEDAVVYDLDNPQHGWKAIRQPFKRRALSVAEAEGKIYVLGGLSDKFQVERKVDVYDPMSNSWSVTADLPGNRKNDGFGTSAFGVDGVVYFSGAAGYIFRLETRSQSWQLVGAWTAPRITHRVLPGLDHSLLAVGGNTKGKQNPMIEIIKLPDFRPSARVAIGE